jgi:membrane-bound ClpP family serine protease
MGFPPISIPLVIGTGIALGGLFFGIVSIGLRAQFKPVSTGTESLTGKTGFAITDLNPLGEVQVSDERWTAEVVDMKTAVPKGSRIVVIGVDGIRLLVRAKTDSPD